MTSSQTHFTLEEASRRLPLVRSIVRDIVELWQDVSERRDRLERVRRLPGGRRREDGLHAEELQQIEEDLEQDELQLERYIAELNELGGELKDPARGLVDFRSHIDGREAFLCWKLGEDEIGYWHELEGGFDDRQSLLEHSTSAEAPSDQSGE